MIIVLILFIGYQLYRIPLNPTVGRCRPDHLRSGDRGLLTWRGVPPTANGQGLPNTVGDAPSATSNPGPQ